ncbi:MAG: hypothetical protein RI891_803 [Gemmatimonadota bacterium]
MPTISTALISATPNITVRWPPRMPLMNGPMNLATRTNGAKLKRRKKMIRGRASFGPIERNIESARATAMTASPDTMEAWSRVSRTIGGTGGSP